MSSMKKIDFLGYALNGCMAAASSPATESIDNICKCVQNGAIAVILKSASSERRMDGAGRRCFINERGFWAESGFDREILPLEQAVALTKQAVRFSEEIKNSENVKPFLTIPSITETTMNKKRWLESCKAVEEAGADAVQLDFFYCPNFMAEDTFNKDFVDLLQEIRVNCHVPVMPKMNIDFSPILMVRLLKKAGIKYVSLLDSIKSPKPMESDLPGESLSVFGPDMFCITRRYTDIFVKGGFQVCAGGGVTNAMQAYDLRHLGAATVQIATDVLLNGFERFHIIEKEMNELDVVEKEVFRGGRRAVFIKEKCIGCGKCHKQTFCQTAYTLSSDNSKCEGCGLCAQLCKNGAIVMQEINESAAGF